MRKRSRAKKISWSVCWMTCLGVSEFITTRGFRVCFILLFSQYRWNEYEGCLGTSGEPHNRKLGNLVHKKSPTKFLKFKKISNKWGHFFYLFFLSYFWKVWEATKNYGRHGHIKLNYFAARKWENVWLKKSKMTIIVEC